MHFLSKFLKKIHRLIIYNIFFLIYGRITQVKKPDGYNCIVEKVSIDKNIYKIIKLSKLSFIDQVALFYNTKCVVGLHGAGFANIVFCKPRTNILELKSDTSGYIIENLAKQNKLNYKVISIKPKTINFKNQSGDIHVEPDLFKNNLK